MRTIKVLALCLALAGICAPSHRRHHSSSRGEAGQFDFYVLVLSWSPEFCYSHRNAAECSEHKGFVVHGLWPQNTDGTFPLNCRSNQPEPSHPEALADIMPAEIVRHEWLAHGTCSGLSGDDYFALIRRAYNSIRIPQNLEQPRASATESAAELKREFTESNPQLRPDEMAVQLRGNYLNAVEICLSKSANPTPIACAGVHDTRPGTFVVPPVR